MSYLNIIIYLCHIKTYKGKSIIVMDLTREELYKGSSALFSVWRDSDNKIFKGKVNFGGQELELMDLIHKFCLWRLFFHCQPQKIGVLVKKARQFSFTSDLFHCTCRGMKGWRPDICIHSVFIENLLWTSSMIGIKYAETYIWRCP